ncbi:hypothetical protein PM8797T_12648 [Gimesia maris DSM 8797]|uniref:Carboxypeptidase regulatory-like domain-containing protein n=2 Tax=Gimesia maris TaxID=122 RepID=A0ABX5YVS7_9PLAN|nr:hypothetical protein [Gimesia maris]EDL61352.1 hypothetical protein PM8797T_12648 [Gimesia maris DSM 8797]QDT81827.1 hypothetical protein Mal35_53120 [Gimesia maris]QEG19606.1 hypothetical protein GmarT_55070 [Gimesia maris]
MKLNMISLCSVLLLLSIMTGCGEQIEKKPTAPVKGIVTFEGKPLETGEVVFFPDSGEQIAHGKIQPDGSFELTTYEDGDGAFPGKHTVTIISERDMEGVSAEDPEASLEPSFIPTKYNMQKTSGLTAVVKEGDNEIKFDLE